MSKRNLAFLISAYVLLALIVLTSAKAASHRHSVNISGGHKHPITDCSDLRIQFDERDAVVRSEEKTLTKSEAAVQQVQGRSNPTARATPPMIDPVCLPHGNLHVG